MMARPRKYYIVYHGGLAAAVAHGLDEARHIARTIGGVAAASHKTQLAAQEHMLWHNYQAYRPGGHMHHLTTKERGH